MSTSPLPVAACIVGLGVTEQGVRLGIPGRELRRRALDLAIEDAGIDRRAVDGYIGTSGELFDDLRHMGLAPRFAYTMQSGGATPTISVLNAIGALATGQATVVACVYGAAPSSLPTGGGGGYGATAYGYPSMYGMIGPAASHALHARRHFHRYGTTSRHLGAVAVTQRAYAALRPGTLGYGQPITIEDHQASRPIVDPFRLLDCTRDTDGGVAVLVTTAERAADLASAPVDVLGIGTGHNIANWWTGEVYDRHDAVAPAAATAFGQAGLGIDDVDVAELYDAFTISVIMQLEAYGFCGPGEGGPFVEAGETGPGGAIPTNTAGGQLSGFYSTGFTPIAEAVRQLRGDGGPTQVPGAEVALVSGHGGNGGVQNTWAYATMLLGRRR